MTAEAGLSAAPAPREPASRPATATDRLQRLLALVPYVISRNVVGLADTAAAFGVTERQLVDDLNMLWCVELRSPDPYCPIDLSYEGGEIVVSQAESIDRPLRLGVDEASALLVALRMLAEVPGMEERSALSRTIAKLEAAAGEAGAASAQVAVQVDHNAARDVLDQVRGALAAGRRIHLSYYVPGRDEATERDVPGGLVPAGGVRAAVPARPGDGDVRARRGRLGAGRRAAGRRGPGPVPAVRR